MKWKDIIPGLRVIFETDQYQIREEYCSGWIELGPVRHRFTLLNNLCLKEEMWLFDSWGLAKAVGNAYHSCMGVEMEITNIHFDTEITGIQNV